MASQRDPESERADLFGNVFVLLQHLTRRTDAALADWGLTSRQWLLLAVLARSFAGRAASLSEAAAAYGSSRQNVKQIALGLETRGYLRLVQDPGDARTTRLQLTDKVGRFDEPEGRARTRRLFGEVFAGLSSEDTRALLMLMRRWLQALQDDASAEPIGSAPGRTGR